MDTAVWYWEEDASRTKAHGIGAQCLTSDAPTENFVEYDAANQLVLETKWLAFTGGADGAPSGCEIHVDGRRFAGGWWRNTWTTMRGGSKAADFRVDFVSMMQCNMRTHYARRVLRVELAPLTPSADADARRAHKRGALEQTLSHSRLPPPLPPPPAAAARAVALEASVYRGRNQPGDFLWEIHVSPGAERTLYIFNDNASDHASARQGGGNAAVRQFNKYGAARVARAAGVCTGWRAGSRVGFASLAEEGVRRELDANLDEVRELVATGRYDIVKYSADPNDASLLGTGIFRVGLDVRRYIVEQLQRIPQGA